MEGVPALCIGMGETVIWLMFRASGFGFRVDYRAAAGRVTVLV